METYDDELLALGGWTLAGLPWGMLIVALLREMGGWHRIGGADLTDYETGECPKVW